MNPQGSLTGKVAIVTGAAQGIGSSYASALAAAGAAVTLIDVLDTRPAVETIRAAGGRALSVNADITDSTALQTAVRETEAEFGGIHILVNNAAIFGNLSQQPFDMISTSEWDQIMKVNVRGTFECTKAVVSSMRKQHYGKIVNISSASALKGLPMLLHYVTSKGAILAMTRSLARELGNDGIRINSLAPGLVMSESVANNATWGKPTVDTIVSSRAIQKLQLPSDLIGSLLFLCGEESDFMTGQTLVVDGGSVMH